MLTGDVEQIKQCIRNKDYDKLAALDLCRRLDISKCIIDIFPKIFERKITRIGAGGIAVERTEKDYSKSLPAIIDVLKQNKRHLNL